MSSANYRLFRQAILEWKQIACTYQGRPRKICPHILGHTGGQEIALVFQFGGKSSQRLPTGGEWRCFYLAKVGDIQLRDGPWHAGESHAKTQSCVEIVDVDVNIDAPPKER